MPKEQRVTDQLNVALSGLEAGISALERLNGEPAPRPLIEKMRDCADEARQHLTMIQLGLRQL